MNISRTMKDYVGLEQFHSVIISKKTMRYWTKSLIEIVHKISKTANVTFEQKQERWLIVGISEFGMKILSEKLAMDEVFPVITLKAIFYLVTAEEKSQKMVVISVKK